jgi:hypothetical protein
MPPKDLTLTTKNKLPIPPINRGPSNSMLSFFLSIGNFDSSQVQVAQIVAAIYCSSRRQWTMKMTTTQSLQTSQIQRSWLMSIIIAPPSLCATKNLRLLSLIQIVKMIIPQTQLVHVPTSYCLRSTKNLQLLFVLLIPIVKMITSLTIVVIW